MHKLLVMRNRIVQMKAEHTEDIGEIHYVVNATKQKKHI